jgi:hypothetical protein
MLETEQHVLIMKLQIRLVQQLGMFWKSREKKERLQNAFHFTRPMKARGLFELTALQETIWELQ